MYKVKVFVTLKESVLDPQGKAVQQSLTNLGYQGVQDVRIGKYMELSIDGSSQDVEATVKEVCEKLLSNPVIEDYRYEIEESVQQ
ncbi:phosphoribosylformylglycinamidine synthase subunit PurS [Bacillus thermotolerans]|uniref:Phosphoribosylformylglycinamidine synthase subunit PurS n=1 Tax=Bacillus thermotolerans TaxID=1221996 RepID=A0A0F5I317_BACTR|nr:phosphoribosylformylglycinamidine synthase subunit PurS [Bacillus thermotolerans]KKB35742.1 Phosphoribosylformylglycinamidine synthase, PurS subunit [Bacillus thermotolerans]KKB40049.1 Phosphoribosylformylglycinamidine synthase, PurS subunit [Bacillus thermotolerans]KKB43658.1 Phosphoribosylformylglycinamidine synthase, PurS subunit [Bacillus thermotolerans]